MSEEYNWNKSEGNDVEKPEQGPDSGSELMSAMGFGDLPERKLKPGDHEIRDEPQLPPEVLEMTVTRGKKNPAELLKQEAQPGEPGKRAQEFDPAAFQLEGGDGGATDFDFDLPEIPEEVHGAAAQQEQAEVTKEPQPETPDVQDETEGDFEESEEAESTDEAFEEETLLEDETAASDEVPETLTAPPVFESGEAAEYEDESETASGEEPETGQMTEHAVTEESSENQGDFAEDEPDSPESQAVREEPEAAGEDAEAPEEFAEAGEASEQPNASELEGESLSHDDEPVAAEQEPQEQNDSFEEMAVEAEAATEEIQDMERTNDQFEEPSGNGSDQQGHQPPAETDEQVAAPPVFEDREPAAQQEERKFAAWHEEPSEGAKVDGNDVHRTEFSEYVPEAKLEETPSASDAARDDKKDESGLGLAFRDDPDAPKDRKENIHRPAAVDRSVVDDRTEDDKFSVFDDLEPSKQIKVSEGAQDLEDVHIDDILRVAGERKASDIHITVGLPPMARVDGHLQPLPYQVVDPKISRRLIYDILTNENLQNFEQKHELDFGYGVRGLARFRVNVYMQRNSVSAALRAIPNTIPSFDELGLPTTIRELSKHTSGLVLVTGPTGSGKSTTIASMIDDINEHNNGHIMTIEDPIEYLHPHKKCMVNQREMHSDTYSFHAALRAVLREDPDIILVGELRDLETIEAALTLAETGHLVFGTLHTRNAPSTIDRVVDVFPADQQEQIRVLLGNTLEGVVSQQLLPKLGGGRAPALEIMLGNAPIRNLIREGKTHQMYSVIETSAKLGMVTMDRSLANLYQSGQVSYEECLLRAVDKENFSRLAQGQAA